MSLYGSQKGLHTLRGAGSKGDLTSGGPYYARSEVVHSGGNGYGPPDPYMDGYNSYTFTRTTVGGGMGGGMVSGQRYDLLFSALHVYGFIGAFISDTCCLFLFAWGHYVLFSI